MIDVTRFYLTTAIDYVNSRPHLGTAYEKIAADVIARYKRLCGFETHFVMGNDEHSQNVFRKARELGEDPLAYCDRMAQEFLDVWERLDISFDDFIRTTEPRHRAGVQELVRRMTAAGDIYEGLLRGLVLRVVRGVQAGEGPRRRRVSDPSNEAGLDPREELLLPAVEVHATRCRQHFAAHPEFLVPDVRRNEILRLLEGGLDDISVSRAGQAWGIPMPDDPSSVIYVWVDALINYLSAVGFGTDEALFAKWWPADLHVIGKDITRFHARHLARDADERRPAGAAAGVRPRVGQLPRREDEQVARHRRRSARRRAEIRARSAAAVPREGNCLRRRRRLHLGAVRGPLQRRPREQSRQPRQPDRGDGREVSRGTARGDRARPAGWPRSPAAALPDYRAGDGRVRARRRCRRGLSHRRCGQRVHREDRAVGAGARRRARGRLTQVLFDVAEAVRVAAILLLPVMPRSAAEILRRVGETTSGRRHPRCRTPHWRATGGRVSSPKATRSWPRSESNAKEQTRGRDEATRAPARRRHRRQLPTAAPARARRPTTRSRSTTS